MAASSAGAIKAYIESLGLGVPAYRDDRPEGQEVPYIAISEDISTVPDGGWNAHDDPEGHVTELVQVDYYQRRRNPVTGVVAESYTVPDALMKALHGCRLPGAPKAVSGCLVVGRVRLLERENNIVHTALTVEVRRVLV